jgi:hypothetical protein
MVIPPPVVPVEGGVVVPVVGGGVGGVGGVVDVGQGPNDLQKVLPLPLSVIRHSKHSVLFFCVCTILNGILYP